MKNTNSKEYKDQVREYLKEIIADKAEGYGISLDGLNPFAWVVDIAKVEIPHEFQRKGDQGGLTEWLQGLGMNIDFYNHDIITLAEKWHDCKLTDKQADMVIENWFSHIALKILQFSRK